MTVRSGIVIASCLTLSLSAARSAPAEQRDPSGGSPDSLRVAHTTAVDPAGWFPISLEPARAPVTDPLKPVDRPVRADASSASASQQEIQVPETVKNLRRADH